MTMVILTKEQADLINIWKSRHGGNEKLITLHIETIENDGTRWSEEFQALSKLSIEKMTKALLIGYQIEQPKFEVGDWVKIKKLFNPIFNDGTNEAAYKLERIFKVTEIVLEGKILCPDRYVHYPENLCHATKEEAFWAELGREVREFRDDDIVILIDGQLRTVNTSFNGLGSAKEEYENKCLKGFYPAESFIKFPIGNE